MSVLRPDQIEDLRDLQRLCADRGIDVVMIGAMAYRIFVDDPHRETVDIDTAVALDLAELADFEESLSTAGWKRSPRSEHRWVTGRGSLMDLVPAGERLRALGKIEWPKSGLTMSLAGFQHVFSDAVDVDVGQGFHFRVVPPCVQALLKIGSFLDDPYGRRKDLLDFRRLLQVYEATGERIFSDPVFEADLADIDLASAFLLGYDLRAIMKPPDRELIDRFLVKVGASRTRAVDGP